MPIHAKEKVENDKDGRLFLDKPGDTYGNPSPSLAGLVQQGLASLTSPSFSPSFSLPSLTSSLVGLLQQGLTAAQTFPLAGGLGTLDQVARTQERLDAAYTFPCANTRGSHYYPRPLQAR